MSVRETDRGARRFLAGLLELEKGAEVTVGVHEDDGRRRHAGSKLSVGDLAVIHEFEITRAGGGRRERSYLRRSVAYLRKQLRAELAEAAAHVLRGQTVRFAFRGVGHTLRDRMVAESGEDTGQLHEAMQVRVRGGKV